MTTTDLLERALDDALDGDPERTVPRPVTGRPRRDRRALDMLRGRHVAATYLPHLGPDRSAPVIFLMALGLFVQSLATAVGRSGGPDPVTDDIFWASLLLIVLPAGVRIMSRTSGRREILTLAIAVPVALEISRLMLYPTRFMWHDELAHGNTLRQIGASHHLFGTNPLLPVSGFYPGLEIATDGVQAITGLSQHTSGFVVLLGARVVLTLALLGIVEHLTSSVRAAAIASLVYVCNPQFLVFNSQFSYQTLALPMAVLTIYLVMVHRGRRPPLLAPGIGAAAGVVHHLTSFLLVGVLVVWLATAVVTRDRRVSRTALLVTVAATAASIAGMLSVPGNPVLHYLGQIYRNSVNQVHGLARGERTHVLFSDFSGDRTPPWQQAALITSVVLTCLLLLPALWQARIWFSHRVSAAIVLCLLASMYPLIPLGHLTFATSEVFDRSSGFVYPGVALVLACMVVAPRAGPGTVLVRGVLPAVVLSVLFIGGVVLGAGPRWNRIPGPYLVAADPRSVDADNLAAARWLAGNAPPGSRILSDRIGRLLSGAVGGQQPVTYLSDRVNVSGLLLNPDLDPADVRLAHRLGLRYVAVDRRLASSLPRVSIYYENGEWGQTRTSAVPSNALTKLDGWPGVLRIYDNGAVAIYDVRHITAPRAPH